MVYRVYSHAKVQSLFRVKILTSSVVRPFATSRLNLQGNIEVLSRRRGSGKAFVDTDYLYDDEGDDDDDFENLSHEVDEEPPNIDYTALFDKNTCPKPSEIVKELDTFIIGQGNAKRSVAIALRNRWRSRNLPKGENIEVSPSNILMVGPTGCGKTEIARRIAKISEAPFVKVEATNYTEVGFHGRDVDKIIEDLFDSALQLIRERVSTEIQEKVDLMVESVLVNALAGPNSAQMTKEHFRDMIKQNEMEDQLVSVDLESASGFVGAGLMGKNGVMVSQNFADILNLTGLKGKKMETKSMKVSTARHRLGEQFNKKIKEQLEESQTSLALKLAQERGIVFIDEIDKICSHTGSYTANASSEGVQRDLLPLVEGSNVSVKNGVVSTDNVLFICAGSFHTVNVSDLIPELQGRLPIRVELDALSEEDLASTLKLSRNSLLEKYKALLKVEGVIVEMEHESCINYMGKVAFEVNKNVENIGARRLSTIVEKVLEELSFLIPEVQQNLCLLDANLRSDEKQVLKVVTESLGAEAEGLKMSVRDGLPVLTITKDYLEKKLGSLMKKVDLQKFIL